MHAQARSLSSAVLRRPEWTLVFFLLAFMALAAAGIAQAIDARQAFLFVLGGALGITLFHGSFGFTGGWRRFVVERRGRALRAQMLLVGLTALLFIPLLASNITPWGRSLSGAYAPIGVPVVVGAMVFGLGMQLGGGCASGTLFTAGGGHRNMLVTLLFFIVGSLLGTAHLPWWLTLPSVPPVNFNRSLGWVPTLALTLTALAVVAALSAWAEKRKHGQLEAVSVGFPLTWRAWVFGPWSLVSTALLLALLNAVTLYTAGHPWSITYAFGLWGAKAAQALGVGVADWTFWTWPMQAKALNASVVADVTSVMNWGVLLGAALAAGLAGRFSANGAPIAWRPLIAAVLGGLLMGYGARLSFGCNIGALLGGIASGSLHGWVWFAMAFMGSIGGIVLRPWFGLDGKKSA